MLLFHGNRGVHYDRNEIIYFDIFPLLCKHGIESILMRGLASSAIRLLARFIQNRQTLCVRTLKHWEGLVKKAHSLTWDYFFCLLHQ